MAATAASFKADLDRWVKKVNLRVETVHKPATMLLVEDVRRPVKAGGNMPVRKGNLRNSLEATINGGPSADIDITEDMMLSDPVGQISGVVNNSQLGQIVSLSFRANYANEQERKHAFVRLAAQKWDQFVDIATADVKGSVQMSAEEDIEIALFTKAKEYTDLPLVFPNYDAIPPTSGSAYVEVTHFRNGSRPITLSYEDFFIGILQMMVCCPLGEGPGEARKRAGDIAALFPKNLRLTKNSTKVVISKRPVLGTAAPTDVKYELPVSIYYETSI